jgi:uroporphyrinogen decarboxylase
MNDMGDYSVPLPELEARLSRFHERVAQAMDAAPPSKEWVRKAIHRQGDGRCPVWLNRISPNLIWRYGDALADLFCRHPDHLIRIAPYDFWIGYQPPGRTPRINSVEIITREAEWTDEWGTRWAHAAGAVGATPLAPALPDWAQLDEYLATRIPDAAAPDRLEVGQRAVKRFGASKYCIGGIIMTLFERLHAVRGMLNVFEDFYSHEAELRRLIAAIAQFTLTLIGRWAKIGVDAVVLTDDWGSQSSLLISPQMWRELFRPHYAAMFAEAHRLGLDVLFHTDGNVTSIVGDLCEIGLEVLDPLQPGAMDYKQVAKTYGGRLSFSSGLDLQHLLSFGTPAEVRATVRQLKATLGRPFGGGYLVSPSNLIGPDVPFANLEALFESAHEPLL